MAYIQNVNMFKSFYKTGEKLINKCIHLHHVVGLSNQIFHTVTNLYN